jgi:hypothetical protein
MDYPALKFWLDVVQLAGTFAIGVYVWMSNRQRVTTDAIDRLEGHVDGRLDDHHERLARLEQDLEHAPTHDDLGQLYERINGLKESVQELSGEFKGVRHLLNVIHQHMLHSSRHE